MNGDIILLSSCARGGRRRAIIACLMTGSHIRGPKTQTKRYWKIITTRIIETGERRALPARRDHRFPAHGTVSWRDSREAAVAVAISKCNAVRCTSRSDPRNDARADVRRDSARCYIIIIIRVPPRYTNACTNSALDILLLVSLLRVLFVLRRSAVRSQCEAALYDNIVRVTCCAHRCRGVFSHGRYNDT